ncbi:hypothetical protein, partial [Paenibacillus apis]|uniref:hypothetical protein n=1 Tax=Paenibacillus apis TaxID=1792174 RepID=UPI0026598F93
QKVSPERATCQERRLTGSYLSASKTRESQRRLTGFVHINGHYVSLKATMDEARNVTDILAA